ncbi:MAG TPA: efflux RND transporter periplasmic adaptor subunit [Beijerinckiaceae bacterium]|jgi:membrane fusion protein (multidrug efflux system)|nr:efflux transporter periplasmic adaptor subunit [Microvirga sp.]HZB37322.1 efflux RND transporter periplasmic adaptor subunit [Beijerinckiaceae bacterium]
MRWYGQLAVIAVLGAAGYGGWVAYKDGTLRNVPILGDYAAKLTGAQNAAATAARQAPPPVVDVDTVKTGRIVETREAVGTVRAYESIIVTAKVSGIVQKISFEEGQKIKAGDILVELDAEERRADIQQAVAEIRRAEALRNEVRTRLDRAMALRRTGAGTEAQVDDLTAQMRTLETAITAAEARRRAAEARLEDLVIRAPFNGRLGTRSVSLGAYVSPGTRITTLDDLSRVRFDFAVPENLLSQLKVGQTGFARSAAFGDRAFEGKVTVIDPRVDPLTRTVRLTAEIPNPDETLKAGMFLSVILQVQVKADAVIVPEEAIVGEGLRHLVFVVKDRVVERRVVRIGQRQEGRVEIVEGLKPGETIIIRGVQRVRPGLTVEPKPVADAPTAEAAPKQTAAPASGNAPSPAAQAVPAPPSVAGRRS